jgi:hypothetical protein
VVNTQVPTVLSTSLTSKELLDFEHLATEFETVARGSNALYVLPNMAERERLGLGADLPDGIGLKILKDLRPPADARYLDGSKQSTARLAASPPIAEVVAAANYLALAGLGPRVWDVAELQTSDGARGTALLVQHAEAVHPCTRDDYDRFISSLDATLSEGVLSVGYPGWRDTSDFAAPDCGGNLVAAAEGLLYVDPQNFRVDQPKWLRELSGRHGEVSHFGATRLGRPERYLYQDVPGGGAAKRNVSRRWDRYVAALSAAGVSIEGRVVLDVGTNLGRIAHEALAAGARWAFGWDREAVVAGAVEVLSALGDTRFQMTAADLDQSYDLFADVPAWALRAVPDSVIFYLSVHQHVGFLQCIQDRDWAAVVYEGHDGESESEAEKNCRRLVGPNAEVGPVHMAADGDSGRRPYMVATRLG